MFLNYYLPLMCLFWLLYGEGENATYKYYYYLYVANIIYSEGSYVFYRDGKYYFMWSENDTRSPEYRVRYAMSDSPVKLDNPISGTIVLRKDPDKQIYGTGHHAVINKPGTDEWYIVYHRFERPDGLKHGWDAGYYREVCIDVMYFNPDGTIKAVKPTL